MKRSQFIRLNTAGIVNNFNRLSWEEQGAYVRLLCLMATMGEPLADDEDLARLMGGKASDWHRVKSSLLNKGKIALTRGGFVNAGSGVS